MKRLWYHSRLVDDGFFGLSELGSADPGGKHEGAQALLVVDRGRRGLADHQALATTAWVHGFASDSAIEMGGNGGRRCRVAKVVERKKGEREGKHAKSGECTQ